MPVHLSGSSARVTNPPVRRRFDTDDARWAAVLARDPGADGVFCYAVRTTGIFCRPSCAARRPSRGNVVFHAGADEAAAAGFRPCKRCAPETTSPARVKAAKIAQACRLIEAAEEPPALDTLAAAVGLSPYHFHRVFKAVAGVTPRAYAAADRARRLRDALDGAPSVTAAILVAKVVDHVEAPAVGLDLPLDIRGTAFQQRVWQALKDIPLGETRSYGEIAEGLGAPQAARAVAQACAANPVALAIPCHRVIRGDGKASGYRWGAERKRALLAREAGA